MRTPVVAVDVAILVPEIVAAAARDLNEVLSADRSDALRLDGSHLPHITLAQQFVESARLDELLAELDRVLRHEPTLPLRVAGASTVGGTVVLAVEATPDLQRVHEAVMDAIEPFESPQGSVDAFESRGEIVRAADVDWVRSYREQSAYSHYRPHVTIGHGPTAPEVAPIPFRAVRIAVCQLGRFCTCRAVIREWHLKGSDGL